MEALNGVDEVALHFPSYHGIIENNWTLCCTVQLGSPSWVRKRLVDVDPQVPVLQLPRRKVGFETARHATSMDCTDKFGVYNESEGKDW